MSGGEASVQSCLYLRERNVITATNKAEKGKLTYFRGKLAGKGHFFGNARSGEKHHKNDRKHTESNLAIMRFYGF